MIFYRLVATIFIVLAAYSHFQCEMNRIELFLVLLLSFMVVIVGYLEQITKHIKQLLSEEKE